MAENGHVQDPQSSNDGLQGCLSTDSFVEFDLSPTKNRSAGRLATNFYNHSTASMDGDIARNLYKEERANPDSLHKAEPLENKPYLPNSSVLKKVEEVADDEWQEMGIANDEVVFGEKGEVMVDIYGDDDHAKGSAEAFGYTRIAAEEQAATYQKSDRKTDFLFKASADPNKKKQYTSELTYDDYEDDATFIEEIDDIYKDGNTALDQLGTTKKLLTESEKLAYVGLTKLVMNEMATSLALWGASRKCSSGRSKYAKRMNVAQSSMGQWQLKMTERLYAHLGVTGEEAKMLDSLVRHGIEPEDLAKSLQKTSIVDNPAYDKKSQDKLQDKDGIVRPEDTSGEDKLEIDVTWTAICDLFLVLIADSVYDARSRALLVNFARYLNIESLDIHQFERRITDALQLEDASDQVWDETAILKDRRRRQKRRKYMYVGLATVGGSLILGLSAGLLAPVIGAGFAAGLATIGISGTGGFLAGAGGTALVTVGATAIGARVGSSGMMKRVADIKTFELIPLHNNKRTNLIITVSGWMNSKADDIRLPYSTVDPVMGDLFSLLWDPEILQSTGQTMTILASEALTQSIQQILGVTILMALMSAIQIPMMLSKLSYIIDNPWNVSLDRAWKAGLILADTLISRNLGVRPVTLLGFSLGSRVIYSCLLELSKRGAHGLVENVMIFGSPVVCSDDQLLLARSVVSGRFVNGYSKKDWILGYLFRATGGGLRRVAGLSPIEQVPGIENFDCTNFVEGHMGYRTSMPKLLKELGLNVLGEEFVEIDEPADPETSERQRKLIMEFDELKKMVEKEEAEGVTKKKGLFAKFFKAKKSKDWWQVYSDAKGSSEEKLPAGSEPEDVVQQISNLQLDEDDNRSKLAEEVDMSDIATVVEESDFTVENDLKKGADDTQKPHKGAMAGNTGHKQNSIVVEAPETARVDSDTKDDQRAMDNQEDGHKSTNSNSDQNNDKPSLFDDDDEFKGGEGITMTFG